MYSFWGGKKLLSSSGQEMKILAYTYIINIFCSLFEICEHIFVTYLHTIFDTDLLNTGITSGRILQNTINNNNLFNGSEIIEGAGHTL